MVAKQHFPVGSPSPQGVEGTRARAQLPAVVVLDNVRSLNNIGSVFRTCDALGVARVVLCGISGTPPHREIHRTALGAERSVAWEYHADAAQAILELRANGLRAVAVEQTPMSQNLLHFVPQPAIGYAFVFGNELRGVSGQALGACDEAIEIPQFGTKHSFNIAVTAGIVLWDFYVKHAAPR